MEESRHGWKVGAAVDWKALGCWGSNDPPAGFERTASIQAVNGPIVSVYTYEYPSNMDDERPSYSMHMYAAHSTTLRPAKPKVSKKIELPPKPDTKHDHKLQRASRQAVFGRWH